MTNPMINIYVKLIESGSRKIESVPKELRAEVERAVADAQKSAI